MKQQHGFYRIFGGLTALVLVFAVGLCGCGSETKRQDSSQEKNEEETDYPSLSEEELEVLAYDNDIAAQLELANRFDYGTAEHGQDFEKAQIWYRKAADAGNAEAMTALGYLYLNGLTDAAQPDTEQAGVWFEKAMEQGNPNAFVGMARNCLAQCESAEETEKEALYAQAFSLISQAYEKGTPQGKYYMAYCLEKGIGTSADVKKAVELYQQTVEETELSLYDSYLPNAAYTRLGLIYAQGAGGRQDYELALESWRKAADDGYAVAQYYLGMLYENGLGAEQDYGQAYAWYQKAADQNYAPALSRIGYLYYNGYGVDADMEQTLYYQKLAAMQGDAAAQVNLGYLFENGIGVERNLQTALAYYSMAAEQEQEGAKEAVQRVSGSLNEEE